MPEYSLHSEIKNWYKISGDELETRVEDFVIDILRGDGLLIEIQTRNLSAIKKKLVKLLKNNRVRLVYPIARLKWIAHVSLSGQAVRRRKSPKKGKLVDLFAELVHMPTLMRDKNFSFEVLFIEEEETRCNDGKGSLRRNGVSVKDRKLVDVFASVTFSNNRDFLSLLPRELNWCFTNRELAAKLGVSLNLAQKITYCLREMNAITVVGKKKNAMSFHVS